MEVMDIIEKDISFVRILKTGQESIINVCNVKWSKNKKMHSKRKEKESVAKYKNLIFVLWGPLHYFHKLSDQIITALQNKPR